MGEYADMVLDGLVCQICGDYFGGGGYGYAVTCAGCANQAAADIERPYACTCGNCYRLPEHLEQHISASIGNHDYELKNERYG